MNEKDTDHPPGDGDSWANETLPMGLRREMLDREIQKLIERKARAHSSPNTPQHTDGEDSHPRAGGAQDGKPSSHGQ
jgi:hypothetical protein